MVISTGVNTMVMMKTTKKVNNCPSCGHTVTLTLLQTEKVEVRCKECGFLDYYYPIYNRATRKFFEAVHDEITMHR